MRKVFVVITEDGVISDILPMQDMEEAIKYLREEWSMLDSEDKEYVDWEEVLECKFIDYYNKYGNHIVHQIAEIEC